MVVEIFSSVNAQTVSIRHMHRHWPNSMKLPMIWLTILKKYVVDREGNVKRQLYSLILLFCINGIIWGKQANLVFITDCNINVNIFIPIDGACNYNTISDQLDLKPNISISYNFDVSDFCFVKIEYSNGLHYSLIIQENDNVVVSLIDNKVILKGNNTGGNNYLNYSKRRANVDSIFDLHLMPKIDIDAINADLTKTFWNGFYEDLDSLKSEENISNEFISILSNDFGYAVAEMLIQNYNITLSGAKGNISKDDSVKIISQIDSVYQKNAPWSKNIMKYRFSSILVSKYYRYKYNNLSLREKEEIIQKYGQDTFGPYIPYILAPAYIQLPCLGNAFLLQIDYNLEEFNKFKMFKFIDEKFPDSQFMELIKKQFNTIQSVNEGLLSINDSIIIINEQVNTLQELFSLDLLKGNRLYIDLWATWCIPCKAEFLYKNELNSVAKKYDVKLLYLSIDSDSLKKKWESDIFELNLKGYHLIVNEPILEDIKNQIYKNQLISIPRYVFINEKGEFVNINAPRPRAATEIEELFSGK